MRKMKVVLVNDTGLFDHFGCKLVQKGFASAFEQHDIECIGSIPTGRWKDLKKYRSMLAKADLLIINGEGTIHHNRIYCRPLINLSRDYPSVLINCVWQDNSFDTSSFLYKSARESISAKQLGGETVPGMIFYNKLHKCIKPIDDIGFLDSVISHDGLVDIEISTPLDKISEKFGRYNRIVTGRFHGACVSAMLGIPFSAWRSNTHKIQGLMIDMGVGNLYRPQRERATMIAPTSMPKSVAEYVRNAPKRIDLMFEKINAVAGFGKNPIGLAKSEFKIAAKYDFKGR